MTFTNTHEQFCFDTAVEFSALIGFGGKRTRKNFTQYQDAIKYAQTYGDKRTMIYAINAIGNSAHLLNA